MTAFTTSPQGRSPFSVFKNRSFVLLWFAELVSSMGTALTSLTASILIYRETGSTLSVGLMLIATTAPTLLVGLIAGVFVDRFDRKRIMIAADLIRAVLIALIPFAISYNIALMYVIVALTSTVTQFFDPANASMMPDIASEEDLAQANSLMVISSVGATTIGFALSGLIATGFPIELAFWIDALTFIVSAVCIGLIKVPAMKPEGSSNVATVVANLKTGIRFVGSTPILRSLLLIGLPIIALFGFQSTLLLPYSLRVLNTTEFQYSLIEAAQSIGLVIAGLLMARFADRLREGQWLSISYIAMGVLLLAFALVSRLAPALILMVLIGFANGPSQIGRKLIIQRNTPREMRGRVASVFYITRDTLYMLGMLLAGLGDVFDVRILWLVSACLFIGVALVTFVMPGLGQPALEWKRAMSLLRGVKMAPGMSAPRAASLADIDALVERVPALASLGKKARVQLAAQMLVCTAGPGAVILRKGEVSDAAYFILAGKAVAGREEEGEYRLLETLLAGDFFGEIAALTGVPRTANVIADAPTRLLQVPAAALRQMSADPALNRLFMTKLTERMARMNLLDLPRIAGNDQRALRDLRTDSPS
jgi:MFS family permease